MRKEYTNFGMLFFYETKSEEKVHHFSNVWVNLPIYVNIAIYAFTIQRLYTIIKLNNCSEERDVL
jgi:hypothetical protein